MKKLLAVLLTLAMVSSLLCGMTVFAADEEAVTVTAEKDWDSATYNAETGVLSNDTYSFTIRFTTGDRSYDQVNKYSIMYVDEFTGPEGITEVCIPTLTYNGTKYDRCIVSSGAFSEYAALNKITASANTLVGSGAFAPTLTSVEIASTTHQVGLGADALTECTGLTSATVKSSVSVILHQISNTCAIETLPHLSLTAPKFVICGSAFKNCTNFDKIYLNDVPMGEKIESGNFKVEIKKNMEFNKDRKDPFSGAAVEHLTFEEGITHIAQTQFRSCAAIKYIDFPSSLTTIDNYAFNDCSALASITIPDSVTTLGQGVFSKTKLTSITLPASITSVSKEGFKECYSLESIIFKGKITSIGENAFRLDGKLSSIVFEGNTETAPTLVRSGDYGGPINSDDKNPMAVTVYYPAAAATAFEDSEYLAQWTGVNATVSFARIQDEQGGCSISDVTSDGANTTVTYTAVDTDNNASLVVLIALYADDEMIGAKTVSMAETTATFTGVTGAESAKIFMWSDLASATPLFDSHEFVPVVEEVPAE